mmetsp:Transcript_90384/g.193738  ORF Transcript_90384/g.193738 Transcript_90384/m.193738 type:complete len:136 (+) Transcript_90384:1338-1745(+)
MATDAGDVIMGAGDVIASAGDVITASAGDVVITSAGDVATGVALSAGADVVASIDSDEETTDDAAEAAVGTQRSNCRSDAAPAINVVEGLVWAVAVVVVVGHPECAFLQHQSRCSGIHLETATEQFQGAELAMDM